MHEQQLRAIHAQACAAVALVDRTITPDEDRFWPLYLSAALAAVEPAAPQAVTLSDEQREVVSTAISRLARSAFKADQDAARNLRALLAAHPTEQRMSDAEREGSA